jgi:hypothetical protein
MLIIMNNKMVIGASALALVLSACGGGSTTTENTTTVSGVVADGYIQGATVCLDKNENKLCDSGEPKAVTGVGGAYTMSDVTVDDMASYPIVVEIPVGAIDEDNPGTPIASKYVLSAPAGMPAFISPLTTMVQSTMQSNPQLSIADAEAAVKAQLGYSAIGTVSLFENYVEAKLDDANPDSAEYARLHQVAQVTAQIMVTQTQAIEDKASAAGLDVAAVYDSLINIIVAEVMAQLSVITTQVDAAYATSTTLDVAAVAAASDNNLDAIDATTVGDVVDVQELASSVVVSPIMTALADGINWIWTNSYNYFDSGTQTQVTVIDYEYGVTVLDGAGALAETTYNYDLNSTAFVENPFDRYHYSRKTDGTWLRTFEGPTGITPVDNGDGTATATDASGARQTVKASQVNLSGLNIANTLSLGDGGQLFAPAVTSAATFGATALGYRFTMRNDTDIYTVYEDIDPATVLCNYDESDPTTYNGLCNTVWGKNNAPATTLGELMYADEQALNTAVLAGNASPGVVEMGRTSNITLSLTLLGSAANHGGTVLFTFVDWSKIDYADLAGTLDAAVIRYYGTWSQAVTGVQVVDAIPAAVKGMADSLGMHLYSDFTRTDKQPMYTVVNGYVRNGSFRAAGSVSVESGYYFNAAAMNDIKANFHP